MEVKNSEGALIIVEDTQIEKLEYADKLLIGRELNKVDLKTKWLQGLLWNKCERGEREKLCDDLGWSYSSLEKCGRLQREYPNSALRGGKGLTMKKALKVLQLPESVRSGVLKYGEKLTEEEFTTHVNTIKSPPKAENTDKEYLSSLPPEEMSATQKVARREYIISSLKTMIQSGRDSRDYTELANVEIVKLGLAPLKVPTSIEASLSSLERSLHYHCEEMDASDDAREEITLAVKVLRDLVKELNQEHH